MQTFTLRLVREDHEPYTGEGRLVSKPEDALPILRQYFQYADREHVIALALDNRGGIIGINQVSIGSLDAAEVHPREVFKFAILANAASIIIAHNHPSGDPLPSSADIELTKRISEAGELLCIKLLDHIIIAGERYHSVRPDERAEE